MMIIYYPAVGDIPFALTLAQYLISLVNLCESSVLMLQDEVALIEPHFIHCLQGCRLPHGLESLQ